MIDSLFINYITSKMYKKFLQYVASFGTVAIAATVTSIATANYYPTQSQGTAYTPSMCQDNGTVRTRHGSSN